MKRIIFALLASVPAAALAVSPPGVKDQCSQKTVPSKKRSDLIAQAKVQPAEAQTIALDVTKGTKVTKGRIEDQEGCLVYSFEVRDESAKTQTALVVDAGNGKVLWKETGAAATPAADKPVDTTKEMEARAKEKMAIENAKKAAPAAVTKK